MIFLDDFISGTERNGLASKSDKILLAVSGGVDSMVMYDLFYRAGYSIGIAHVNFSLRGDESDAETDMVLRIAEERKTPMHFARFDTHAEMDRRGLSLQEAARELRYEWFEKCVRDYGYDKIAVAHNLNDSVETFFINTVRGTGIRGLAGITPVNRNIIRPLLKYTRADIESYARTAGVEYRNDSSNDSVKYLRNKIRHIILPKMTEISPDYLHMMSDNMERVRKAAAFLDRETERIREKVVKQRDGYTELDLSLIDRENLDFLLYELLSGYGFNQSTVGDIVKAFVGSGTAKWFNGKRATAFLSGDKLLLRENGGGSGIKFICGEPEGYGSVRFDIAVMDIGELDTLKTAPDTVVMDYDRLSFPLRIRRWRDGDSFVPFGMKGRKKVGDYMTDAKANAFTRRSQLVVESIVDGSAEILWLVGLRASEKVKVTKDTRKVLIIKVL